MSISRGEIAALCAEHDKFVAELDDWKAQREAQALVRKKTYTEADTVYDEPSANDELVDALVIHSRALGDAVLDLRRENDKLKAQLDLVLQLIGSKNTDDDRVVDLPRNFIRRRNNAA
jgi:hypothetical protein